MTAKFIELTITPYGYKTFIETTRIEVIANSKDRDAGATVNGINVAESYGEIVYMLIQ